LERAADAAAAGTNNAAASRILGYAVIAAEEKERAFTSVTAGLLPTLTKPGYVMTPSAEVLATKTNEELASLDGFSMQHDPFGLIEWEGHIDVRKVNLDQAVSINRCSVSVYDLEEKQGCKPPINEKLNSPAKITLYNVFPSKKKGGSKANEETKAKFQEKLIQAAKDMGVDFISYDKKSGIWIFRAKHFSHYGFFHDDSDDDDDLDESNTNKAENPNADEESKNNKKEGSDNEQRKRRNQAALERAAKKKREENRGRRRGKFADDDSCSSTDEDSQHGPPTFEHGNDGGSYHGDDEDNDEDEAKNDDKDEDEDNDAADDDEDPDDEDPTAHLSGSDREAEENGRSTFSCEDDSEESEVSPTQSDVEFIAPEGAVENDLPGSDEDEFEVVPMQQTRKKRKRGSRRSFALVDTDDEEEGQRQCGPNEPGAARRSTGRPKVDEDYEPRDGDDDEEEEEEDLFDDNYPSDDSGLDCKGGGGAHRLANVPPRRAGNQADSKVREKLQACRNPVMTVQNMSTPLGKISKARARAMGLSDARIEKQLRYPSVHIGMFVYTQMIPYKDGQSSKKVKPTLLPVPQFHVWVGYDGAIDDIKKAIRAKIDHDGIAECEIVYHHNFESFKTCLTNMENMKKPNSNKGGHRRRNSI
jgi:hypothetical protein